MNLKELSKEISYALRHAPWEYELELDEEGFVPIEQLLHALNEGGSYDRPVTKGDLEEIIRTSDKKRHEILGDRIRALYGHSVPQAIKKEIGTPPRILYHGTTNDVLPKIKDSGILPMKRQYVHLSTDQETARHVASRRTAKPGTRVTLLAVDTAEAIANGATFFIGNDKVWLADRIPPQCISIMMWDPLLYPSFVPLMDFPLDKYPECKMSVDEFTTEFPALTKGSRNDNHD